MPSSRRWRSSEPSIVAFDDGCNLCSGAVQFIIARDPHARFRFVPLQSEFAVSRLAASGAAGIDSIVLFEEGRTFTRSTAALRIVRKLTFPWPLLYALIAVPRPVRDRLYDYLGRRRYRWFGSRDRCLAPTPALRARFLAVDTRKPAQLR